MLPSHFFANLARMKLIYRWPLMRNINTENVAEHSHQVAVVAHMLALIRREIFAGEVQPERVATLALFHDASEVLTGDLPTRGMISDRFRPRAGRCGWFRGQLRDTLAKAPQIFREWADLQESLQALPERG